MKPLTGILLGVGALGAAIAGAVWYEEKKAAAATPTSTPNSQVSVNAGDNYTATASFPANMTAVTQASAQAALPAGVVTVTGVSQTTQGTTTTAQLTFTGAATGTITTGMLAAAMGAPAGTAVSVVDTTTATQGSSSFGGSTPKQLSANYNSNGTTLSMNVGDGLKTSLLMTNGADWSFSSSDSSVLPVPTAASTQASDPNAPGGTDQVDMWTAVGEGTAVITGTSSSSAAAKQTWKLTVNVSS